MQHQPSDRPDDPTVTDDERPIDESDDTAERPSVPLDAPVETPLEDYLEQHQEIPTPDDDHPD